MLNRLPGRPVRPIGGLTPPARPSLLQRPPSRLLPLGFRSPMQPGRYFRSVRSGTFIQEVISQGAISSQATLDIAVDGRAWDEVVIHLIDLVPATDNTQLYARFSQASAFLSGASDYQWAEIRSGSLQSDAADSEIQVADGLGTSTNERFTASFHLFRPTAASFTKTLIWHGGYRAQSAAPLDNSGWGELILNGDAIEDIRFLMSSGDLASGYHIALGWKYS
jgi:hypothetical protein